MDGTWPLPSVFTSPGLQTFQIDLNFCKPLLLFPWSLLGNLKLTSQSPNSMEIAYFCYTTLFDVLFRLGVSKVKVGVWAGGHLPFFWNVPCCNPAECFIPGEHLV